MQSATWLAFCVSSSLTRTSLHFFPAAENVTAPYPANCALTLFGGGQTMRSVVLEGGRLGNPDGVRLEEAFADIRNEAGSISALAVELSTPQHSRLNLICSGCVVEINSFGYTTRFRPAMLELPGQVSEGALRRRSLKNKPEDALVPAPRLRSGIACIDAALQSSVVVVNGGETRARVISYGDTSVSEAGQAGSGRAIAELLPYSIQEIPLGEELYSGGLEQECSWGRLRAVPVSLSFESVGAAPAAESAVAAEVAAQTQNSADLPGPVVSSYMVYRDANSRRIMSVVSL